ncbi:MAG: hypothetical protein J0M08_08025 [Bacteroidetes bacterium]|nr:hypothetical protein [Bacteroidota bacterium]
MHWFKILAFVCISNFAASQQIAFNKELSNFCNTAISNSKKISKKRKAVLNNIAIELLEKKHIVYACKTNTRRTQLLQTWTQTAFYYYGVVDRIAFSYGDSIADIYPGVVDILKQSGFYYAESNTIPKGYTISLNNNAPEYIIAPKNTLGKINSETTILINICSSGETFADQKMSYLKLPYKTPTEFEAKKNEQEKYMELNKTIATEMFYMVSKLLELQQLKKK